MSYSYDHPDATDKVCPARRRAPWRQRLVEAERGLACSLRDNSTISVHLFGTSVVLATAAVIGLSPGLWAVLILALAMVFAAELWHQVIKSLAVACPDLEPTHLVQLISASTGAVLLVIVGAVAAIVLVFTQRLMELWPG